MTKELRLGVTVLSPGGRTTVPRRVVNALRLEPTPEKREKILWTQEGDQVLVERGTPQSSFRKSLLNSRGRAAVPRHIRRALKLESVPGGEVRMMWVQRGRGVYVRKGAPRLEPTD